MLTGRRTYSKWLVRGLVVFAIGMTAFAAVSSRERHSAANSRSEVLSQYVALEARSMQKSDPALAMQLALIAYRQWPSPDARSALLDTTAGEMPTRLLGPAGETGLALGDDGHRVAIAYQAAGMVKLYALRYSQLTWLANIPAPSRTARIDAVAISHRGTLLAVGDSAGHVALWSLARAKHPEQLALLSAGAGPVHGLSFSPGGAALAAADADGSLQRWSLADTHQPRAAAPLVAPGRPALQAVSYSDTGQTLTAAGRAGILVTWRAHGGDGRPLDLFHQGARTLTAVAYSPDGRWLAAGARDGSTRIWRLDGRGRGHGPVATLAAGAAVTSLGFSRDTRFLAVGSADRFAHVWSSGDWRQVVALPHPVGVTGVAFSDGDRRLLSSNMAGTTMIWQYPSANTYAGGAEITGLKFSRTRPRLAVSTRGGATQQWDVVDEWRPGRAGTWDATPLSAAPANAYWIKTTTTSGTSSTGTTASGTTTTTVEHEAIASALKQTRTLTSVTRSLLSRGGQLLITAGSNDLIYLWKLGDPGGPQLAKTLSGPSTPITRLALSPDGQTLAVASAAGHVWLSWVGTAAKAYLIADLRAAPGPITALAFSPSDETLVAGGIGGRLTFWHFRPFLAVNRICALAGTPITLHEWETYVPQASYRPPCETWTPPQVVTAAAP